MIEEVGRYRVRKHLVSSDVRNHNIGIILELLSKGGFSRSYLSKASGLSPGAVTQLVNELQKSGLITSTDDFPSQDHMENGRRKKLLVLSDTSHALVVVELRNDSVRVVCETLSGLKIHDVVHEIDFRQRAYEDFADFTAQQVNKLVENNRSKRLQEIMAVGIVVPAPVFDDHDTLLAAIDYGWGKVRLADAVHARLHGTQDTKVMVLNDANSSLWAEYVHICESAPVSAPQNLLYIKSDVGIGGSAIIQGRTFNGPHGTAIEPGHLQLDPHGALCECGRRGCLVTTADPAIVIGKAGLAAQDKAMGREETLRLLLDRDKKGDRQAHDALTAADDDIIQVLGNMIMLLTPSCVILGGYLGKRVTELSRLDIPTLDTLGFGKYLGRDAILPSYYGSEGTVVGALMRVRSLIFHNAGYLMSDAEWSWPEEW